MKKAFAYLRISNDDQSRFSISGQLLCIEEYCKRNNISILKVFTDDGYSAKDFNRPAWKEMQSLIKKNTVNFVIVWKYDRLIRNAVEGLVFVEHLEKKLNTILVSVMENYAMDPTDPYFFKLRADMFVDAEFERRRISDRTKMGLWSGKSQGRYLRKAPYGYKNVRMTKDGKTTIELRKKGTNNSDASHIIPHPEQSLIVKKIFEDFQAGHSFASILNKAKENGFQLTGKEVIKRILTNVVYAGLIKVPAYKASKEKTIPGVHEAIIPEDIFWKVYYKVKEQAKPTGPKIMDSNLPIRGFIQCENCGAPHTGTRCKGRSAYYYYYWCNTCRGKNYSAEKINKDIETILSCISLPARLLYAYKTEVKIQIADSLGDRQSRIDCEKQEIEALLKKLKSIEEKYIDDRIDQQMFKKWSTQLNADLAKKKIMVSELELKENTTEILNEYLPYLSDLVNLYRKASIPNKIALLKSIFPGGLSVNPNGYRTALLADVFSVKAQSLQGLLEIKQSGEYSDLQVSPAKGG
jgi:site-specific DNA recombinase